MLALLLADLDWSAPPECPSREIVERDARALAEDRATQLVGNARIRRSGSEWILELTMPQTEPRILAARSCGELGQAVAAILAMRGSAPEPSQPPVENAAPASSPPDEPTDAVVARPTAARDRTASHDPSRPRRGRFAAGLSFGGALGLPNLSPAMGTTLSFTPGAARVEIYGLWSPPSYTRDTISTTRYTMTVAGVRGCAMVRGAWLGIGPCVGAEGGVVTGATVAPNDSSVVLSGPQRRTWAAATAGALLTARMGPITFRVDLEAIVPTVRTMGPDFSAFTAEPERTWAVVPRALAGAELTIP